jgi:hypothetical protein
MATPAAYTHLGLGICALSLAATRAISFDFSSSGYLDVSVPRVCPRIDYLFVSAVLEHNLKRVAPFGYLRLITGVGPLS